MRQAEVIDLALICLVARGHLLIEDIPGVEDEVRRDFGFDVQWDRAKRLLELT